MFIHLVFFFILELGIAFPAPTPDGFVFPDDRRHERKLEPIITPPVLPILEHLERDPSTLLKSDGSGFGGPVKPKWSGAGLGGGFNVRPSGSGGLTASISSSAAGGGASQSASQSFSFGFNEGFSASHSASQSASFNGFGNNFSGSQASSQAASFGGAGNSVTGAGSTSSAFGGSASQSGSSAFGFNSLNGFPQPEVSIHDTFLDFQRNIIPKFDLTSFENTFRTGKSFEDFIKSFNANSFSRSHGLNNDYSTLFISNIRN